MTPGLIISKLGICGDGIGDGAVGVGAVQGGTKSACASHISWKHDWLRNQQSFTLAAGTPRPHSMLDEPAES